MARAALTGIVFLLLLPAQALAVGKQIAEVESLTAEPVIAGDEIVWPANYGYCVPTPASAGPACIQYLAHHDDGVVRAGHLFEAPRVDRDRKYGVSPVVTLAASRGHIGYERYRETGGFRFNHVLLEEHGVLTPRGGDVFIAGCLVSACPFEEETYDEKAGIDVWGHTVATGMGPSGKRGIHVRDLATRKRRFFRDRAEYCCADFRLAGRYLATEEMRVWDWRRKKIVLDQSRSNVIAGPFDVQADGRLFAFESRRALPWLVVSSPKRRRWRPIRKTDGSRLIAARNRVAWQYSSIGVANSRGRLLESVTVRPPHLPGGELLTLADFDGRCLVWTQTRFERGLAIAKIFVAPVAGGGPACD